MGMTPPKMFPPSLPFAASQPNVISQAQAAPVLAQQQSPAIKLSGSRPRPSPAESAG
jgi:hypothetical protein